MSCVKELSGIGYAMFTTLMGQPLTDEALSKVREHFINKVMNHWYVGRKEATKVVDEALKKVVPCVEKERKARGAE